MPRYLDIYADMRAFGKGCEEFYLQYIAEEM